MTLIKLPKAWELPEAAATPESAWIGRRRFLKTLAVAGAGLTSGLLGCRSRAQPTVDLSNTFEEAHADLFPVARNERYTVPERPLSPEERATGYNNYYEFTTNKERVRELVGGFVTNPWTVEVAGAVHRPQTLDLDEIVRAMPLEERIYRFRCVEAWSMTVPWTGFPLSVLLDRVEPLGNARYIRFFTANRPEQMPGMRSAPWYPWPYYEGLRMDEARNELTLLATGIYGRPLPRQNGAPIRLVVPWKYGFKNIKSIVRIELVEDEPPTFWSDLVPSEYDFWANVDPTVPHPRWSQATERLIDTGQRIPTQPFNGYGEFVADLYR